MLIQQISSGATASPVTIGVQLMLRGTTACRRRDPAPAWPVPVRAMRGWLVYGQAERRPNAHRREHQILRHGTIESEV
jgi:hypothetical protein